MSSGKVLQDSCLVEPFLEATYEWFSDKDLFNCGNVFSKMK